MQGKLAVLGSGRMGEALLGGLLRSGSVRPDQVVCTDADENRAREVSAAHGVAGHTDSAAAAAEADVLLIAVKPQNMAALLSEIAPKVSPRQTIISVAAGVRTATIEAALADGVPVVRVMSNTPVFVDEAMSALAPGRHADQSHLEIAKAILGHVGKVVELPEAQLDAVTALSGSGPAYFFLIAEAMIDAGIQLGLSRDIASELVAQTMVGSGKMLRDTGRQPVELREAVTSPGGTTIAALRVLEERGLRAAFLTAIEAAQRRSVELAEG